MNFESWSEFWAMGGHGLYVWLCYGVGILVLLWVALSPYWQRKALIKRLFQQQRRQQAHANEGKKTNFDEVDS